MTDPYVLLAKLGAIAALLLGTFGAGMYVEHTVFDSVTLKNQIIADQNKLDGLVTSYNVTIATANKDAQAKSDASKATIDSLTKQLQETQNELTAQAKKLRDQAKITVVKNATGVVLGTTGGLLLNGASCYQPGTALNLPGSGNPSTIGGTGYQASCRLAEPTADALISIASDGNAAINQLYKLIDAYNAVKDKGCSPTNAQGVITTPSGDSPPAVGDSTTVAKADHTFKTHAPATVRARAGEAEALVDLSAVPVSTANNTQGIVTVQTEHDAQNMEAVMAIVAQSSSPSSD